MKFKLFLLASFIFLVFLGCAKPPTAEMDIAKDAVFRAQNDPDAVQYAGNTLARAQDALRRMQTEADSKRYDAAKTYATEAVAAADRAITEGRAAAARAREEAASMLSNLKNEIDDTNRNVSGARYSELDLDYDTLDGKIRDAYRTADLAEADQISGRYQDAINKAMSVRLDLFDINQKVAGAVTRSK